MLTVIRILLGMLLLSVSLWFMSLAFHTVFWYGCGLTIGSLMLISLLCACDSLVTGRRLRLAVQKEDVYYNDPDRNQHSERGLRSCSWSITVVDNLVPTDRWFL